MAVTRFAKEQLLAAPRGEPTYRHTVRLQDVDAAGVVFFANVLAICNDALLAWLDAQGLSVARLLHTGRLLAPVKHAEADYLAPLRFGDVCEVELVAVDAEATQVTVGYRLRRQGDGEVVAVAQMAQVSVDGKLFSRVPFPPEVQAVFARLGGMTP
jgi:1,4-dihydroxy-2-naphthoyl-CoA hydrolase